VGSQRLTASAMVWPELTEEERLYDSFQQESASAHTAIMSLGTELSVLVFGQHVRPILIIVIFFFWDFLKDRVYNSNPQIEEELKENIGREMENIPAEQLQRVNLYFFRLHEECLCVERPHS
jgi:hypothetical protein